MIAQVYVNTTNLNIDKPFDYSIPAELEDKIVPGVRVKVSFGGGNMPKEAFVTEVKEKSDFGTLKPIRSVTDEFPVLTKSGIDLCFHMRKRYFCTFSEAAQLCIPPGTDAKFEEWICLCHKYYDEKNSLTGANQQRLITFLEQNEGSAEMTQIKSALGKGARASVNALLKKGILEKSFSDKRRAGEKTVRVAFYSGEEDISYAIEKLTKPAPKQAAVLSAIMKHGEMSIPDLLAAANATRNAVESLHVKGLVSYKDVEVLRNPLEGKVKEELSPLVLSPTQEEAVKTVTDKKKRNFSDTWCYRQR